MRRSAWRASFAVNLWIALHELGAIRYRIGLRVTATAYRANAFATTSPALG